MPEPWGFQTLLCLGIVICVWVTGLRDKVGEEEKEEER